MAELHIVEDVQLLLKTGPLRHSPSPIENVCCHVIRLRASSLKCQGDSIPAIGYCVNQFLK